MAKISAAVWKIKTNKNEANQKSGRNATAIDD